LIIIAITTFLYATTQMPLRDIRYQATRFFDIDMSAPPDFIISAAAYRTFLMFPYRLLVSIVPPASGHFQQNAAATAHLPLLIICRHAGLSRLPLFLLGATPAITPIKNSRQSNTNTHL
jgi:hypothetical protein